jgi:hypothetical protein
MTVLRVFLAVRLPKTATIANNPMTFYVIQVDAEPSIDYWHRTVAEMVRHCRGRALQPAQTII